MIGETDMKKILKGLIPVLFAFAVIFAFPSAFKTLAKAYYTDGNLSYKTSGDEASIVGCKPEASGYIVIPETLGGYPVVAIGDSSFKDCKNITELKIPSSVKSIGSHAFEDCIGLAKISIPDSVENIGFSAFNGCTSLKEVELPNNIKSIDGSAFRSCIALTKIQIPNSVESIGNSAFEGCTGLKEVELSSSIKTIYPYAFEGCTALTEIKFPNGIKRIESSAFTNCTGLTKIQIPSSVESIDSFAFTYCTGIKSLEVDPGNTTYHSKGNCIIKTSSKAVVLGCNNSVIPTDSNVTSIGSHAFFGCTGLKSMTIPNNIIKIDDGAFSGCKGLKSITIPNSVKSIGETAFKHCTGLTKIQIPNSVKSIKGSAFVGCTGLKSITIPSSVTSIGISAFVGCSNLEEIKVDPKNKTYHSKDNCLIETWTKTLILGCKNSIIPTDKSVISIGNSAFDSCKDLKSITIPSNITKIGTYAFSGCKGLNSITLQNGMTEINGFAFFGCTGLKNITIPSSVKKIGRSAFFNCTGLKSISVNNPECEIYSEIYNHADPETFPKNAKIIGASGSTAEAYAKKFSREFEAHSHKFSAWKTVTSPTCAKAGSQTRTCSDCKATETKAIPATAHSYKTVTTKATLQKDGSVVSKCSFCGLVKSRTVISKIKSVKLSSASFVFNGKAKTPSVTVKDSKGKALKKGTDFTLKFSGQRKQIGKYTVTVTFIGKYSGTKTLSFKIVPGKVSKLTRLNQKKIAFSWNEVNGASGYEIFAYNAKSGKFKKVATVNTNRFVAKNASGKVQYKVRAFTKVGKQIYRGAFSAPATFRTK